MPQNKKTPAGAPLSADRRRPSKRQANQQSPGSQAKADAAANSDDRRAAREFLLLPHYLQIARGVKKAVHLKFGKLSESGHDYDRQNAAIAALGAEMAAGTCDDELLEHLRENAAEYWRPAGVEWGPPPITLVWEQPRGTGSC